MLCFGCGCDLSGRSADRRRLVSPTSSKVVIQWKQLALQDNDYDENELDNLITGSGKPDESGKMCRKCFTAYERLADLTTTLKGNQSKFLEDTMKLKDNAALPPPAKRPCYSAVANITNVPTSSRLAQASATSSPPVVVS